jgi:hypothetical protein
MISARVAGVPTVEQLMNKTSGQALELNKRGNLIKRLKLVS